MEGTRLDVEAVRAAEAVSHLWRRPPAAVLVPYQAAAQRRVRHHLVRASHDLRQRRGWWVGAGVREAETQQIYGGGGRAPAQSR